MKIAPATIAAWAAFTTGLLVGAVAWDNVVRATSWPLSDWAALIGAIATVAGAAAIAFWQRHMSVKADLQRLRAAVNELASAVISSADTLNDPTLKDVCDISEILAENIDRHRSVIYEKGVYLNGCDYHALIMLYHQTEHARICANRIAAGTGNFTDKAVQGIRDRLHEAKQAADKAEEAAKNWK